MAKDIVQQPTERSALPSIISGRLKAAPAEKAKLALRLGEIVLGMKDKNLSPPEAKARTHLYVEKLLALHPLQVVLTAIDENLINWEWFPTLPEMHKACNDVRERAAIARGAKPILAITDQRRHEDKIDPAIAAGLADLASRVRSSPLPTPHPEPIIDTVPGDAARAERLLQNYRLKTLEEIAERDQKTDRPADR